MKMPEIKNHIYKNGKRRSCFRKEDQAPQDKKGIVFSMKYQLFKTRNVNLSSFFDFHAHKYIGLRSTVTLFTVGVPWPTYNYTPALQPRNIHSYMNSRKTGIKWPGQVTQGRTKEQQPTFPGSQLSRPCLHPGSHRTATDPFSPVLFLIQTACLTQSTMWTRHSPKRALASHKLAHHSTECQWRSTISYPIR